MNKKKIGIITFSNNANYGGSLQEFALYKLLEEKYSVKCIYYKDKFVLGELQPVRMDFIRLFIAVLKNKFFNITNQGQSINNERDEIVNEIRSKFIKNLFIGGKTRLYLLLRDIFNIKSRLKLIKRYKEFWQQYLIRTKPYTVDELLAGKCERFDIYVSGSDQVWNLSWAWVEERVRSIYFLSFAPSNAKRISFASSFGHYDFKDKSKFEFIKKYLSSYANISVREESSVTALKKFFGMNAFHALDPTLMFTKKQWLNKLGLYEAYNGKPYLLVYMLFDRAKVMKFAKRVAQKLDLLVYVIDTPFISCFSSKEVYFPAAGPVEFIKLFANASFVITNSFHGTAFSVNFNIPFFTVESHVQERMVSFLNKVKLNKRLVPYNTKLAVDFDKVSFTVSNQVLENERKKCLEYLENAIMAKEIL